MKNQKGFTQFILILCIAVVGLGLIGFYLYNGESKLPSLNSVITPTPTPRFIDISDWKVYKNKLDGFEFKYPSNEYIVQIDDEEKFGLRNSINLISEYTESQGISPPKLIEGLTIKSIAVYEGRYERYTLMPFTIWVFDNKNNLNIEEWKQKYKYYPFTWGDPTPPLMDFKTNFIIGKEARLPEHEGTRLIYLNTKEKVIIILIYSPDQAKYIGNQILSTLRLGSGL